MLWRVDVEAGPGREDGRSRKALVDLRLAGLDVSRVRVSRIYLIEADWDAGTARRLAREVFADPVLEEAVARPATDPPPVPPAARVLVIFRRPGVTDPVERSALKALSDVGAAARRVRCATRYLFPAGTDAQRAARVLSNDAIEEVSLEDRPLDSISVGHSYRFERREIDLRGHDGEALLRISDELGLALTLPELHRIRDHFDGKGRAPTDIELETIAQTWSEHCKHKTLTGEIVREEGRIRNLLKSTIMKATRDLDLPWCVSVFRDNAGIVEFDSEYNVCFKVETHNHPSAIEPYGGANTGLGGVIRDVLGCGLGARPICSTDVFCVGPPDTREEDLPGGVFHPERILRGIVAGVRDYGNRMGIPTVNGAVVFDERYTANPLVYCGTVGILPRHASFKKPLVGDRIVVVGGRTGRDGIHGATFSSTGLHEQSESVSGGAVQIGDAIVEKRVLDMLIHARDEGLFTCVTDCGAGGLSSAVGEMGEELGAEVSLEKVPLKYEGLSYAEIWISEAQERMVLAVSPDKLERLFALCAGEEVEATEIGFFTGDRRLRLTYKGNLVGDLEMEFLHDGLPVWSKAAAPTPRALVEPDLPDRDDYAADLIGVLSSWNVCSKEWVVRQYDHEVQGGSVVKPMVGASDDGPGDAAVVRPRLDRDRGLAIGCGIVPSYGDLSPYDMAACAIDEAMRNVVAVGGDPRRTALLDNFSWGSPEDPGNMEALVEACRACYDIATAYGAPFISGKDSLNNEFRSGDRRIVIPPTLLISALALVEDVRKCVTMDAKTGGNLLCLVGRTGNHLGGSEYYRRYGHRGANVPKVDPTLGRKILLAVAEAIGEGIVRACHDLSEGGLAVAVAETAFAGGFGARFHLSSAARSPDVTRDDQILFSESPSRFLLEVAPGDRDRLGEILREVPFGWIGEVTLEERIVAIGLKGSAVLDVPTRGLKEAWQGPLRW